MANKINYAKQWAKYNAWQTANASKIINPISNKDTFAQVYATQNPHDRMKALKAYATTNKLDYKVALKNYARYKEEYPNGELKLKDFRTMPTTEIAEIFDLKGMNDAMKAQGVSAKERAIRLREVFYVE